MVTLPNSTSYNNKIHPLAPHSRPSSKIPLSASSRLDQILENLSTSMESLTKRQGQLQKIFIRIDQKLQQLEGEKARHIPPVAAGRGLGAPVVGIVRAPTNPIAPANPPYFAEATHALLREKDSEITRLQTQSRDLENQTRQIIDRKDQEILEIRRSLLERLQHTEIQATREIHQKELEIAGIQGRLTSTQRQLQESQRTHQDALQGKQDQIDQLERDKATLHQQITDLSARGDTRVEELRTTHQAALGQLEHKLQTRLEEQTQLLKDDFSRERNVAEKRIEALEDTLQRKETEKEELVLQYQARSEDLQRRSEERINQVETQYTQQLQLQSKEIETLNLQIGRLEASNTHLREENLQLESAHREALHEQKQNFTESLEEQKRLLIPQISQLRGQVRSLEMQKISILKESRENERAIQQEATQRIESLIIENTRLQTQLDTLTVKSASLEEQKVDELAWQRADFETKIQELEDQIRKNNSTIVEIQEENALALETSNRQLESVQSSHAQELSRIRENTLALEGRLTERNTQLTELSQALQATKETLQTMEGQLERLRREKDDLSQEHTAVTTEFQTQLTGLREEIATYQSQLRTTTSQLIQTKDEIQTSTAHIQNLQVQLERLHREKDDLSQEHTAATTELETRNQSLLKEKSRLEMQLADLKEELTTSSYPSLIDNLRKQRADLEEKIQDYETQIRDINLDRLTHFEGMKDAHEKATAQFTRILSEKEASIKQLARERDQLLGAKDSLEYRVKSLDQQIEGYARGLK